MCVAGGEIVNLTIGRERDCYFNYRKREREGEEIVTLTIGREKWCPLPHLFVHPPVSQCSDVPDIVSTSVPLSVAGNISKFSISITSKKQVLDGSAHGSDLLLQPKYKVTRSNHTSIYTSYYHGYELTNLLSIN